MGDLGLKPTLLKVPYTFKIIHRNLKHKNKYNIYCLRPHSVG